MDDLYEDILLGSDDYKGELEEKVGEIQEETPLVVVKTINKAKENSTEEESRKKITESIIISSDSDQDLAPKMVREKKPKIKASQIFKKMEEIEERMEERMAERMTVALKKMKRFETKPAGEDIKKLADKLRLIRKRNKPSSTKTRKIRPIPDREVFSTITKKFHPTPNQEVLSKLQKTKTTSKKGDLFKIPKLTTGDMEESPSSTIIMTDRSRTISCQTEKIIIIDHAEEPCDICSNNHPISECNQFLMNDAHKRQEIAETKRVCYRCLKHHKFGVCGLLCQNCANTHHPKLWWKIRHNNQERRRRWEDHCRKYGIKSRFP